MSNSFVSASAWVCSDSQMADLLSKMEPSLEIWKFNTLPSADRQLEWLKTASAEDAATLARKTNAPQVLEKLLKDRRKSVFTALASNPNLPKGTLKLLIEKAVAQKSAQFFAVLFSRMPLRKVLEVIDENAISLQEVPFAQRRAFHAFSKLATPKAFSWCLRNALDGFELFELYEDSCFRGSRIPTLDLIKLYKLIYSDPSFSTVCAEANMELCRRIFKGDFWSVLKSTAPHSADFKLFGLLLDQSLVVSEDAFIETASHLGPEHADVFVERARHQQMTLKRVKLLEAFGDTTNSWYRFAETFDEDAAFYALTSLHLPYDERKMSSLSPGRLLEALRLLPQEGVKGVFRVLPYRLLNELLAVGLTSEEVDILVRSRTFEPHLDLANSLLAAALINHDVRSGRIPHGRLSWRLGSCWALVEKKSLYEALKLGPEVDSRFWCSVLSEIPRIPLALRKLILEQMSSQTLLPSLLDMHFQACLQPGELTLIYRMLSLSERSKLQERLISAGPAYFGEAIPFVDEALHLIPGSFRFLALEDCVDLVVSELKAAFAENEKLWHLGLTLADGWLGTLPELISACQDLS